MKQYLIEDVCDAISYLLDIKIVADKVDGYDRDVWNISPEQKKVTGVLVDKSGLSGNILDICFYILQYKGITGDWK